MEASTIASTKARLLKHDFSRAPDVGLAQPPFGAPAPPHPPKQLEDPSLKPQPFPPHPPLPLPLTPLGLFAMLWEGVAWAGVAEGAKGRALQVALGARPTSGGTRDLPVHDKLLREPLVKIFTLPWSLSNSKPLAITSGDFGTFVCVRGLSGSVADMRLQVFPGLLFCVTG